MTLSPDGEWLWTGEEWIPAPPTVSPEQSRRPNQKRHIRSAAKKYGISRSQLSKNVSHYDLNEDGYLSREEIFTAASAIHSPAEYTYSGKRTRSKKSKRDTSSIGTRMLHFFGLIIMVSSMFLPWISFGGFGSVSSIEWIFIMVDGSGSGTSSTDLSSLIPNDLLLGLFLLSFGPFVAIFSCFVTLFGVLTGSKSTWVMGVITSLYMLSLILIGFLLSVNLILIEITISDFFGVGVYGMFIGSLCTAVK